MDYLDNSRINVTQHNKLINAHFTLGIYEMRLFLSLLSKIKKEDKEFRLEEVPVSFFRNEKGKIYYEHIKEAADKIMGRKIAIENEEGFDYMTLMARCTYKKGEGTLKAMFNQEAKPYLLELKGNFTISQLDELLKLKSYSSHRIYWLLKQYNQFRERTIPLDKLKALLGLEGKYAKSKDFKKYVLNRAQEELVKTDMAFSFEEIREGLKVKAIRFILEKQSIDEGITENIEHNQEAIFSDQESRLMQRLKEFQLEDWQVQKIIEKVGADAKTGIWMLVNEIKMARRDGQIKGSIGGYAAKKIDGKYGLGFFK